MAFTNPQLDDMRRAFRDAVTPRHTKPQLNALFQAIDDWMVANQASAVTAMNNALPGTTATEKKVAFAVVCYVKYLTDKAG